MFSQTFISFLLWMVLVLTVVVLRTSAASDKVRLSEVNALTLHRGKMTTGRRSSPVSQLRCVGGSAKGAFTPKVVQCINQGSDGKDAQWRCDADLPHDIEFGEIRVSCEGYDYPDDPYILRGSCGLEYELDYTAGSGGKGVSRQTNADKWDTFATFIVIAFIAYVIYTMWSNRYQRADGSGYRPGPGGGGPGSGGGGPGGFPGAPPPYDDTSYGKPPPYGFRENPPTGGGGCGASGSGTANNGGNFWTGASLGALGGYLASNYFNSDYSRPRNRGFFRDTGFMGSDDFFSGPSTSSGTRSSSGFGGTSRR